MLSLSLMDRLICEADIALQTIFIPKQRKSKRVTPAVYVAEQPMSTVERSHVAGLMRVNHAGEVCAQALYQGQASSARLSHVRKQMQDAAAEEIDHLAWCEQRLSELDSRPSVFNPLWYIGSFVLGACAGWMGDRWSLGFVAETERQVSHHLQHHLEKLPPQDAKSYAILTQMKKDEQQHAEQAVTAGAAVLPLIVRQMMRCVSRCLTLSSYRV